MISSVILIVIILSGYFFLYAPKQQSSQNVQQYKKDLYNTILCRYSCPLTEISLEDGSTIFFPEKSCSDLCVNELTKKGYTPNKFSSEEIITDNLVSDIDIEITNCRDETVSESGENLTLGNSKNFFECVTQNLKQLKEKYPYIN